METRSKATWYWMQQYQQERRMCADIVQNTIIDGFLKKVRGTLYGFLTNLFKNLGNLGSVENEVSPFSYFYLKFKSWISPHLSGNFKIVYVRKIFHFSYSFLMWVNCKRCWHVRCIYNKLINIILLSVN